jgi:hypothetical protein
VLGRLLLDNFKGTVWQVQIALALGFFGLLIGLTVFSTPGSVGAFALGAGAAYFWSPQSGKSDSNKRKAA